MKTINLISDLKTIQKGEIYIYKHPTKTCTAGPEYEVSIKGESFVRGIFFKEKYAKEYVRFLQNMQE